MQAMSDYRKVLRGILEDRCRRNPRYSQRAFGRDLGIRSSRLSEILGGKVGMSAARARRIALRLGYSQSETEQFMDMVESQHARSKVRREIATSRLRKHHPVYQRLNEDVFRLISDWYHLAILELLSLRRSQANSKWIAKSLRISEIEAKSAVERMCRLKLLAKNGGRLIVTHPFVASTNEVPSQSVRRFHDQILSKARESLHSDPLEQRDFSAVTVAIDKSKLAEVKEKIKDFRRQLNQELSISSGKNAVYCLSIQFFELTKF